MSPALRGIVRSLRIYHGHPHRALSMDALYGQFLAPGDLAFDIGAHVGDRVSSFRRLGARVVAVEPQPLAMRALRLIHGRDEQVELVQQACGTGSTPLCFHLNEANPTLSSAATAFIAATDGAQGWEGENWTKTVEVASTTLDDLIDQYGHPGFVKIDVEGFETEVLHGLSTPLPTLSFEFTTIQRSVALACVARLEELAPYEYHLSLGETHRFSNSLPLSAEEIASQIRSLPQEANSGDVYAIRKSS